MKRNPCKCEHGEHGPQGCPGHAWITIETPYGKFEVCQPCWQYRHMRPGEATSFGTHIEKRGLTPAEHEELYTLAEEYHRTVRDRAFCFGLNNLERRPGLRTFALTLIYVAGAGEVVHIGSVRECIAYLRGAVFGACNSIHI